MSSPLGATSTISGLVSGMDTSSIVSQLMQIEAQPQTLLKTQLSAMQTKVTAYRDVNSAFAALGTAAAALTGSTLTSARTATTTGGTATATAAGTANAGSSVSYTVTSLAAAKTAVSTSVWSSRTQNVRDQQPAWPLTVLDASGVSLGTIDVPANATLDDAAAAINKSGYGLIATVMSFGTSSYRLQVTSQSTGTAGARTLQSAGETSSTAGASFTTTRPAKDATLDLGSGLTVTSSSNTFKELMTGVSLTVSAITSTPDTLSVGTDNAALTSKVQAMVTAVNTVLSKISKYTDSSTGSTAALKGNWSLNDLSGQVLQAVSSAVGTSTAASAGLQLNRSGQLTFDAAAFQTKLAADPTLVQKIFGGTTAKGADNVSGTIDDTPGVDGISARLQLLANRASDSTSGLLTSMAKSGDAQATGIQKQIDDWDLRLKLRQTTLNAQFTAMETALGTLKSQSSWLSSQINQLPTSSSSK